VVFQWYRGLPQHAGPAGASPARRPLVCHLGWGVAPASGSDVVCLPAVVAGEEVAYHYQLLRNVPVYRDVYERPQAFGIIFTY